jgi:hypothetical protein
LLSGWLHSDYFLCGKRVLRKKETALEKLTR